jgi:uncharacterized membrane protein
MNTHVYDEGRATDVPGTSASRPTRAPTKPRSAFWLMTGLLILSSLPLVAGALRLLQLAGGAELIPAGARFDASPLPVVVHILSAAVYLVLGAFQFAPRFRRRRPGWHRAAGWLLVPCGLLVGLSALWMTLFYPWPAGDGVLLYMFRLLFGTGMVVSIVLGVAAIRRRDVQGHRAWMMRGYALGLGAATQMLTLTVGEVILGPPTELSRALLMGTAWSINLLVAEWAIRKRAARVPVGRAAPGRQSAAPVVSLLP